MQFIHNISKGKIFQAPVRGLLIASIVSLITGLVTGIFWLSMSIGVILLTYVYLILPILRSDSTGAMTKGLTVLFLISCMVIVLRIFVLEVYQVAGASMEDTLIDGDRIVVSKLNYGPLLPRWISDEDVRLRGTHSIARNDVVLFTLRSEPRPILKRIVAVPGDTIVISHSELYRQAQRVTDPVLSKRMYRLWPNNIDSLYNRLVSKKLESYYDNGKKAWFAFLNSKQANELAKTSFIDSLGITPNFMSSSAKKIFHVESELQWNLDNIGPLLVPKKGLTIPLNETNYLIYRKTILLEEGHDLQYTNGKFTLDGEATTTYTFENDYYYALGDNFERSLDSRHYGFIRHEHVIGKAVLLLFRSGNRSHDGAFCTLLE